ncbi:MAG: hypothetical protein MZV63_16650 [Marinilabiliales bacterium]|nr:hypothetical protein [Marinilabiliales bacterium]
MTWDFDVLFENLVSRLTAKTSKGRYMMDNAYAYDEEINILSIVNSAEKPASNLKGGSGSFEYTYDDLYRITNVLGLSAEATTEHRYSMEDGLQHCFQHPTENAASRKKSLR